MSAPISPALQIAAAPATTGGRPGRAGRAIASYLDLRISDVERMEVADELGRHYSEGRLDEAEFTHRLDRVMSAATYQGLAGVLEDLPRPSSPALVAPARRVPPPARRDRRQRTALGQIIVLALFAILLVTVSHAVNWVLGPVLWICLLGLLIGSVIHRRLRR
jgi:Domain of unknown function (DUF1707)